MGRLKKCILSVLIAVFALCMVGCVNGDESPDWTSPEGSSPPQQSVEGGEDSGGDVSSGDSSEGASDWSPWVPID